MHIRAARVTDAEQVAQAEYDTAAAQDGLLVARPLEIPVEAYREKIRALGDIGAYIVMEDGGGGIAGHLFLEPLPLASCRHVAQITVVVHPGHVGKGNGRRLMEHAIDWARRAGIEKIELRVRSTNPRAIALYGALGFVREGVLRKRIKLGTKYADDICMALFLTERSP